MIATVPADFEGCPIIRIGGRDCIIGPNGDIYHRWGNGWCHRNPNRPAPPRMITIPQTISALEHREQQHKETR